MRKTCGSQAWCCVGLVLRLLGKGCQPAPCPHDQAGGRAVARGDPGAALQEGRFSTLAFTDGVSALAQVSGTPWEW